MRASEGRRPTVACHGTLFGLEGARDAIRESGEAIVTLGPLDAITLHERGMRNVVSCMGGGIGTKAARALVTIGAKGVVLLFPTNGRANQATHASLGAALSVPARLSLARIEGSDTLSALMGLDVGDVKTFCDEAPEIVSAALDGVVGCFDLDSPQELIEAASKACAAFATAVDGDRARAGLVAGLVAGRLGIRDPTALTHALLADGPVGRPEKVPGIDPLPIENPRRSLPMARVTIDLPLPDLPHTSLAEEAVGARIASDNLAIGAHMRHGREPTPPHTPPHSQTKQE